MTAAAESKPKVTAKVPEIKSPEEGDKTETAAKEIISKAHDTADSIIKEADDRAKEIISKAKEEVEALLEKAREASDEGQVASSDDPEDPNDLLNRSWVALANVLDDGVAKDQVLGALTSVQLRAREVVLEHQARRGE
ncbi:hypothetical protein SEA_ZHENGYI_48 [Microbacterium phage Zhengyi]|nr:hypothetical protein SEA_ZHENGYI_48 [Microbacterium phage Zhengyi]